MPQIRITTKQSHDRFLKKVKSHYSKTKDTREIGKERIILKTLNYVSSLPDVDKHIEGIINTL